ncbi:MAG: flagellar basal body P-ring protein FlgI [Planctomycetota bacterium]
MFRHLIVLLLLAPLVALAANCQSGPDRVRTELTARANPEAADPKIRTYAAIRFEMGEFLLATSIEQALLKGMGVVYGLKGTGSIPRDLVEANQLRNQLKQLVEGGFVPDFVTFEDLETGKCALVNISARFPLQRESGTRFDIVVTNDLGAVSLNHGQLYPAMLTDASTPDDLTVWARTRQDLQKRVPLDPPRNGPPAVGPDGQPLPEPEPLRWLVRDAGYLVKDLPASRNSNETLLLSVSAYNRDIFDAIDHAIRQRYPFEVAQRAGGLGRGRIEVRMSPGFSMSAEEVLDDISNLTFELMNTRVPLVIFDNRSGEIQFINGTVRLQQRWLATAHVADPTSPDVRLAEHHAVPGDPSFPCFSWGNVKDTGGSGMMPVPYILAGPDEKYEDIKKVMENRVTDASSRRGALIGQSGGLKLITWRNISPDPKIEPEEVVIDLPHNDLRDVLAVLRDELHFPGPELKEFVIEAHRRGFLSDCFVMERFPAMRYSEARDMTWFPATDQVAVGNVVLRGKMVPNAGGGTWDFLPGPIVDGQDGIHGFTTADANQLLNLVATLEGNRFRWHDGEQVVTREIRLSEATWTSLFRARAQLFIDASERPEDAIERVKAELEKMKSPPPPADPHAPPQPVNKDAVHNAAVRVYPDAIAYLKREAAKALPVGWKENWPGRPSVLNGIKR